MAVRVPAIQLATGMCSVLPLEAGRCLEALVWFVRGQTQRSLWKEVHTCSEIPDREWRRWSHAALPPALFRAEACLVHAVRRAGGWEREDSW